MRGALFLVGITPLLLTCSTVDTDAELSRHTVDKVATAAIAGRFSALACYSTPKYVSAYSKKAGDGLSTAVHLAKELDVAGRSADSVDISLDTSGNLQITWRQGDSILFRHSYHIAESVEASESGMFELDPIGATKFDGPDLLLTAVGSRKTILRIFIDQSGNLVLLKSTEGSGVALVGFLLPVPFTERTVELAVFPRIPRDATSDGCRVADKQRRHLDSERNDP